jgi:uncharacterized membrane protein YjgN (DUF898 family)
VSCSKCGYPEVAGDRCPRCGLAAAEVRRIRFHGTGSTLFGIYVVNLFLTLLTLGIYSFWGRVKVRRYLLSETEFEGDRFAYHGTGRELLMGWLKALLVFGVPLAFLYLLRDVLDVGEALKSLAGVLLSLGLLVFIAFAMVSARRYRLSRISWRGIRFSFRGRALPFIRLFVGGTLLSVITAGFYYPFFDTRRYAFMTSHSHFGNRKFDFNGRGWDLFPGYLLVWLLTLPTLGLSWFWYLAQRRRYFAEHTSFGSARFRSTITGGRFLLFALGSLLLLVVTLGLAWPWLMVRYLRFNFAYLTLEGPLDLASVLQEAQVAEPIGEGLASFLDVGFDLG